MYGFFADKSKVYLLLELASHGDLFRKLKLTVPFLSALPTSRSSFFRFSHLIFLASCSALLGNHITYFSPPPPRPCVSA